MRKSKIVVTFLVVSWMLLAMFLVSGCSQSTVSDDAFDVDTNDALTIVYRATMNSMTIYRDNETGVEYIVKDGGGITPRLNADGSLYVDK